MKTVKTAISLSERVFDQTEEMAGRLGMNRSQLIAAALAEFLERHREDRITERLNEIYSVEESGVDPVMAEMQSAGLSPEDWS